MSTSEERKRCQFCKEKYGVEYPEDIGFGRIEWWNVPNFALGSVGHGLKSIPRIRSEKTLKAREDLEKWENSEEAAHLRAQIDVWRHPPGLTEYRKSMTRRERAAVKHQREKEQEEYWEAHQIEIKKAYKEYESAYEKYSAFLDDPEFDDRDLTRDELAQLGINFDPYN
jgi:hypothetical protein